MGCTEMRRARFALVVAGVLGVVGGSPVIAETPGGTPLPSGQRFESPEHGIAVTMPRGWLNTQGSAIAPDLRVGHRRSLDRWLR